MTWHPLALAIVTLAVGCLLGFWIGRQTGSPSVDSITVPRAPTPVDSITVPRAPTRGDPAPIDDSVKLVRVIDGDTIRAEWRGVEEPIHLLCINTPERGQPGFHEATTALRKLLDGRNLRLEFETPDNPARDRYERLLAYVFADDRNLNVEMVRLGHSPFYTKYGQGRFADAFRIAEEAARNDAPRE